MIIFNSNIIEKCHNMENIINGYMDKWKYHRKCHNRKHILLRKGGNSDRVKEGQNFQFCHSSSQILIKFRSNVTTSEKQK